MKDESIDLGESTKSDKDVEQQTLHIRMSSCVNKQL